MHFQIFLVCHSHWLKETLIKPVRFKKNIFIFKDWTPFKTKEKRGFRGGSDENLFWLAFLPSIKGRLWFLPPEAITSIITLVDHMTSLNFGRKNCLSILQSTTKDYTFLERTGSEHVFALIRGLLLLFQILIRLIIRKKLTLPPDIFQHFFYSNQSTKNY